MLAVGQRAADLISVLSVVIIIALVVLVGIGVGLYERHMKRERSNALYRWIAIIGVGMIAFLVLGITVEDWYFFWFFLSAGILAMLLGVGVVLRWRRGRIA